MSSSHAAREIGGSDAFQPWEYRTETGFTGEENLDLTGYSIAAVDGDIGHIDEATYETWDPASHLSRPGGRALAVGKWWTRRNLTFRRGLRLACPTH
jgi:hypothetical protein